MFNLLLLILLLEHAIEARDDVAVDLHLLEAPSRMRRLCHSQSQSTADSALSALHRQEEGEEGQPLNPQAAAHVSLDPEQGRARRSHIFEQHRALIRPPFTMPQCWNQAPWVHVEQ